jgi:hypothetical protein
MDWNEEWQVFVDIMGLPIPKRDLKELREQLAVAEAMDPKEIAAIAKEIMKRRYPDMVERFDFTEERYA